MKKLIEINPEIFWQSEKYQLSSYVFIQIFDHIVVMLGNLVANSYFLGKILHCSFNSGNMKMSKTISLARAA